MMSSGTTLPADAGAENSRAHEDGSPDPAPEAPEAVIAWRRRLRNELAYRPFLITLGAAVALRIVTMAIYFPAIMDSVDSPRFARSGLGLQGLFDDYWMPAGYPFFLKIVHHISSHVWFTIAIQHLLGLFTGTVIFLVVRRCSAPRWLACVAAGVVLFSGDLLYLEHIFMADQFLFMFTVLACAAAIMGLVPHVDRRWLAASGALAMTAMLSRSPGLAVVLAVTVMAVLASVGGLRARLLSGACVVGAAAAILTVYVAAFHAIGGRYLGIDDMSGWNLYSRVASFADCRDFTPPAGTKVLCESTPPSQRLGAFEYSWDPNSVSRRNFSPQNPSTAPPLRRFAIQVIEHQAGDYLQAVLTDLGRYIDPSIGSQRGYSGQPRELVTFGFRDAPTEAAVESALSPRYSGVAVSAPGARLLGVYQQIARPDRLIVLAALLLTLAGFVLARGAARIATGVFGLSALGLFILPTMTLSYDFRYGIPPTILLTISGLLALWGIVQRRVR